MRFGAMNYPIHPVVDEIQAIGALGFDFVELAMDPPEANWERLVQQHESIKETLQRYRLDVICHLPTFVHTADLTASIREASRREVCRSVSVAAELGARKLVLHPSFVGGLGRSVPDLVKRHALESLEIFVPLAESEGCTLCLENLFDRLTPFSTIEALDAVFNRWPRLGMTLDVGHAFIDGNGMDRLLAYIHHFGERIRHVHISDNRGQRDDHLPVGDGAIDFRILIAALKGIHFDGTMTLEVFTSERSDLVRSREVLQRLLGAV